MRNTKYKLSIITLALAFVLSLAAFFGVRFINAHASGTVTASGSNVFTASGDATVLAHEDGEDKFYTMFVFGFNADTITYRRNLAYYWHESATEEGWFSMELGFETTSFDRYVIKFESQQYNRTKDNKTANYVIFFPAEEGKVNAVITTDGDTKKKADESYIALDKDHITIEFTARNEDKYSVKVGNATGESVTGDFENIGGYYARSSTSTSTPVYPLSFKAEFSNEEGERDTARMALYSLNNQSFILGYNKVNSPTADGLANYYTHGEKSGEYVKVASGATFDAEQTYYTFTALNKNTNDMYYGGTVYDDAAPVFCLDKEISYLTLGAEIDVDYAVIDVLRTSPSAKINYYVLTYGMYENAGDDKITDYNDRELFTEITSTSTFVLETDADKYVPVGSDLDNTAFDAYATIEDTKEVKGYFKAEMLAKVYAELTDVTSNAETAYVYLDWYVKPEFKITLGGKTADENASFIAVAKDKLGATYNYDGGINSFDKDGVVAAYQAKVDEAAKNLSAGSASYIYLPSPESLFEDNASAYTDMRYGIYFYNKTQQSNTSLAYSNLSINITQPGDYVFTIYATDAASNSMYYLKELDGDKKKGVKYITMNSKEYEIVEFAAGEIWTMFKDEDEEGLADYLPWFYFNVGYTGVTFDETPGLQSTAYVGTAYSSASFKINGISGSYDTVYRLFVFDRAAYYNGEGKTLTYQEFVDNMTALYDDASTQKYFKEIPSLSDLEETDPDYELYKDYGWNKTSTSFTPQDNNAFYMIRAEVTDKHMVSSPVTCNLGIVASVTAKTLKGESDWLKNNVTSVVLLSIAGVALVGIILLLVIKPKDKGDVDERFENARRKNKKN